eukprot:767785-Hanusia_phi.AAC.3
MTIANTEQKQHNSSFSISPKSGGGGGGGGACEAGNLRDVLGFQRAHNPRLPQLQQHLGKRKVPWQPVLPRLPPISPEPDAVGERLECISHQHQVPVLLHPLVARAGAGRLVRQGGVTTEAAWVAAKSIGVEILCNAVKHDRPVVERAVSLFPVDHHQAVEDGVGWDADELSSGISRALRVQVGLDRDILSQVADSGGGAILGRGGVENVLHPVERGLRADVGEEASNVAGVDSLEDDGED